MTQHPPIPTSDLRPAGPAITALADQAPPGVLARTGDDTPEQPYWRPHSDFHTGTGEVCGGQLRWGNQDTDVWDYSCTDCDFTGGIHRNAVDERSRTEHLMSAARLPVRFLDKPLSEVDGNRDAMQAAKHLLQQWGAGDARPRPPMFCGTNGLGKTHLLVRTAQHLIERRGVRLRYCTFSDLFDEAKLAMNRKDESAQEVFEHAATVPVLVLDDLGVGMGSDWTFNVLEALVDRRYRAGLPVMGATNVAPGEWRSAFGPRAGSRLMELCAPVPVTGTDWRTR